MGGSDPHILLVGGDGHPSGVPRHITDLARALRGLARVTVLSEPDRGGYRELAAHGARHVTAPGLASRARPGAFRKCRQEILNVVKSDDFDIVWLHARLPVLAGRQLLASGAWRPETSRVALTYHGLPFGRGHRPLSGTLSLQLERRLLRRAPPLDLVCLSQAQAASLRRSLGTHLQACRLHVLGNASSLGELPAPEPKPPGRHLVMTGRAGWQKNYDRALRLMRALPADVHLTLCGQGTDTEAFAARMRRLAGPAALRITALGPLPDIRPLLARADAYMLTSRYEGLPIGALEASEAGLPLILSDFEGAGALLAGHPLGLRLPADPARAAAGIDQLLNRYLSARQSHCDAIRAFWAERYAPDRFDAAAQALVSGWLTPAG